MKITLAIDPGKKLCGAALFVDDKLRFLEVIEGAGPLEVIHAVDDWYLDKLMRLNHNAFQPISLLVVEGQTIYRGVSRENPNDLLPLAFVSGGICALVDAEEVRNPSPKEWTGSVKKAVRHQRLLARMSAEDRALVEGLTCSNRLAHNAVDAIGLGLFALGLLRPHAAKEGKA